MAPSLHIATLATIIAAFGLVGADSSYETALRTLAANGFLHDPIGKRLYDFKNNNWLSLQGDPFVMKAVTMPQFEFEQKRSKLYGNIEWVIPEKDDEQLQNVKQLGESATRFSALQSCHIKDRFRNHLYRKPTFKRSGRRAVRKYMVFKI